MFKKIIAVILITVFSFVLIYNLIHIVNWHKDNNSMEKQVDEINNIVEVNEVEEIIIEENKKQIKEKISNEKKDIYWYYTKVKLIDVDIKELQNKNKDTVGWIQVGEQILIIHLFNLKIISII